VTPRGLSILLGAALLVVAGRLLGVAELYVAGAATAVLCVVALLAARLASATIAARRATSHRLRVGDEGVVMVELRNESRLPATLLLVEDACHPSLAEPPRFVVPGLRPGRTVPLRYGISGTVRGRYRTGPVLVRVRDPFGLAERVRRYSTTDEVLVYPRIESLGAGPLRGLHRGTGTSEQRRLYAAGDEFYTMREYVQGDDLRQVHWPSTAHRQTLMVRQQEMPWQAQATVFCDTRAAAHLGIGADSTLEKGISAAASVLWHLAQRGYGLRLLTDNTTVKAPANEQWSALLERLADLQPSRLGALAPALATLRDGGEGLLVAVLAPPPGTDELTAMSDVRALLTAGRSYTSRIALIVRDRGRRVSSERAATLARMLSARHWRAVTVAVDEPLANAWHALEASRRRATAVTGAAADLRSTGMEG
jgi:uncharacterized protein (DUF58 family)